jgi:CBS domain-containing protein
MRTLADAQSWEIDEAADMIERVSLSPDLGHVRVCDAMHAGILSCAPDAPLAEVAGVMAKHHVHAVAISRRRGGRLAAVVSDLDVAAAIASGEEPTALETAATEPVTVSANESLRRAAQLMSEHRVSHLVVVEGASGYPVGVLSTLDVAAAYVG